MLKTDANCVENSRIFLTIVSVTLKWHVHRKVWQIPLASELGGYIEGAAKTTAFITCWKFAPRKMLSCRCHTQSRASLLSLPLIKSSTDHLKKPIMLDWIYITEMLIAVRVLSKFCYWPLRNLSQCSHLFLSNSLWRIWGSLMNEGVAVNSYKFIKWTYMACVSD